MRHESWGRRVSLGDELAAARRQAGLTITQVSQRTCIRETIVRGIEREDYSACGGDFYARGHIRSIARAVGLDPEQLISEYDATQAPPQPITAADVFQPITPVKVRERKRAAGWSVVLLIGVVAAAGIVGFRYFSTHHHKKTPPAAAADHVKTSTSPRTTTQPTQRAPAVVRITLVAKPGKVTWVRATAASGHQMFAGDIRSSSGAHTWTSKHPITIRLGNPGGAVLYLDGKKEHFASVIQPVTMVCNRTRCRTTQG